MVGRVVSNQQLQPIRFVSRVSQWHRLYPTGVCCCQSQPDPVQPARNNHAAGKKKTRRQTRLLPVEYEKRLIEYEMIKPIGIFQAPLGCYRFQLEHFRNG